MATEPIDNKIKNNEADNDDKRLSNSKAEVSEAKSDKKSDANDATPNPPKSVGEWLYRVLQGALIGVGGILPGISGGVLCVLFGIYRPMINLLSHPIKTFKKSFLLFLPIGIGVVIGFVGLAKVLGVLFDKYEALMVCLFAGLILGTLPSLVKESGNQGRSVGSWVGFGIAFVFLFVLLFTIEKVSISITPNPWWYLFCGVMWGLSLIAPGMSSAPILTALGLYAPMSKGIGNLDPLVILPMLVGIVVAVAALVRPINYLFNKRYSIMHHIILGAVVATTLPLIPHQFNGVTDVILKLVAVVIGFAFALGLDKLNTFMLKRSKSYITVEQE